MKYPSIPSAQSLVFHCKAKGIKYIVISPGSRNAPLVIGFSEDSYFECFSVVDERSAAFFALGIAQQQKKAVAVVCTSGSALLNYYPAIAEAFYSNIPLIVISADRPFYKVDIGDGQTIRQDNVFERHIGYSANLKQDVVHSTDRINIYAPEIIQEKSLELNQEYVQNYNDSELNRVINIAIQEQLPVHINIPFEEPLYGRVSQASVFPKILDLVYKKKSSDENLEDFALKWNSSKKKMVLIGVNSPQTIEDTILDSLGKDSSVLVFTETTSNMHHPNFFSSIDSILAPIEKSTDQVNLFKQLQPEILITLGGQIVSKKIKAFLRQYKPTEHWHIGQNKADNTFFSLTKHFKWEPNKFFGSFLKLVGPITSDYFDFWSAIKVNYEIKRTAYLKNIPFSDMAVLGCVFNTIPKNYQLHLANSSTVRYSQLFTLETSIKVFCNRGTSGIDGSTSTAVGGALKSKYPTLLITGDLSFFYDSNGLWNKHIRPDFRIIVINNGGGGIFRILPGKEDSDNFETYFETTHNYNASKLCEMHDIAYKAVNNQEDLFRVLDWFYKESETPRLLEVKTPRLLNDKILLGYFDFIS